MYIWAWFISRHAGNMTDKLSERELKSLKSKIFWEQLDYLRDELGDPGRYFAFLKRKVKFSDETVPWFTIKGHSKSIFCLPYRA